MNRRVWTVLTRRWVRLAVRLGIAGCLAGTGYIHADLYVHGYLSIPTVGAGFLLLSAGCFAVALLLPFGDSFILRLGAAGLALGALAGFVASRTVGVFGFTERGLQPAPQALLSVVCEVAALLLLLAWVPVRPGAVSRPTVRSRTATSRSYGSRHPDRAA